MEITSDIVVDCPHCNVPICIAKLSCCIFRHGSYKSNNKQINPHSSKLICDKLINDNLIYGCGKPFKITYVNDTFIASICDYI